MNTTLGLFNLGGGEILLILALVLILFGSKKIPELARGLGQGIKEFKKATNEVTEELSNAVHENPPPAKRVPPATTVASEPERTISQSSSSSPSTKA